MAGLLPTPPSCSGSRESLRHCGEGLRPRLQRAGERQLRLRAEIWHSSSPRRLLREPWRAGLLSWGSSSLRRVMVAGEFWKTSSGSSSSSTMEGRGFSGAAPLSERGCGRARGEGQGWSPHGCQGQTRPPLAHLSPSSPLAWHKPAMPATAVGTGSSGRAPGGRADDAGSVARGTPARLHRDRPQADTVLGMRPPTPRLGTQPSRTLVPPGQPNLPQPRASAPSPSAPALASAAPRLLSFLCCCHDTDELPNLGLHVPSQSQGCTPNPSPGSAIRASAPPGACHWPGEGAQGFCRTQQALFASSTLGLFIPLLGDGHFGLW